MFAELTQTTLKVSNFGFGGSPITLNVDEPGSLNIDFSFGMATFGLTIDGTNDSVSFDQAYSSSFGIDDVFSLFETAPLTGTSTVTVPAGSKWTLLGVDPLFNEPVFRVDSGSTSASGTGFAAPSGGVFPVGSCFSLRASFGFPVMPSGCIF